MVFVIQDVDPFFEAGQAANIRHIALSLEVYTGYTSLFKLLQYTNRPFSNEPV